MTSFIVPIQPMERMSFAEEVTNEKAAGAGTAIPFQSVLQDAVTQLKDAQAVAAADGYRLTMGDVDNLAQLQINAQKAETMLQTTVQLTSRVVNAYKEIMQMQI